MKEFLLKFDCAFVFGEPATDQVVAQTVVRQGELGCVAGRL